MGASRSSGALGVFRRHSLVLDSRAPAPRNHPSLITAAKDNRWRSGLEQSHPGLRPGGNHSARAGAKETR
jgi:hypothetical protein